MAELLGDWKRTITCGELRGSHASRTETLMGWAKSVRDHGGVIFVDLRDRHGVTQLVFRPEVLPTDRMDLARKIGLEYVVAARGVVQGRPEGARNPRLPTGDVEVLVGEFKILNESEPLPFLPADEPSASEELRLKYRYIDLRREPLQAILALRHAVYQTVRKALSAEGFLEIETPLLVRPTPEGARDYLVPSRVHRGKFFALPQSPQLYKQLLMVSGFDRYFQLARCLRDEDPRADRQPEFAQIDIEMSFPSEDDVFNVIERMFVTVFQETMGMKLDTPFPRLTYQEAMTRYGSDKPDLRIPLEIADVTDEAALSGFAAFAEAATAGGRVACLATPVELSRKEISGLEAQVAATGVKPLFWARLTPAGLEGGVTKSLSPELAAKMVTLAAGKTGIVFLAAGKRAFEALGVVRTAVGAKMQIADPGFNFAWVRDFPLFSWNDQENRWEPAHHMFSMPYDDSIPFLDTDPGRVKAHVYDLVCNGVELGSGSIRIHLPELQLKVMKVLGLTPEDADKRFGFLLEAMRYGAPPHGGIALGLDRTIMLMSRRQTIRDTIAFPKTTSGSSLMDGSPSEVDGKDISDLGIKLV
jgi:aspartyl-tRNA synthetase